MSFDLKRKLGGFNALACDESIHSSDSMENHIMFRVADRVTMYVFAHLRNYLELPGTTLSFRILLCSFAWRLGLVVN